MKSHEFLQGDKKDIVQDFLRFCYKRLKLTGKIPPIRFSHNLKDTKENHRMGYYDPEQNYIWIYVGNRNLADILRTLCHELVHTKQRIEKRIGDERGPGAKVEQEADMVAGELMKIYGKMNRNIYESTNKPSK